MSGSNVHKSIIYEFDEWMIKETEFDIKTNFRDETIFTTGNGYIGMRGNFEEGYRGPADTTFKATYINGFYEEYDIEYPEGGYGFPRKGQAMLNVADAKIIIPFIDGERFDLLTGRIHAYERKLDMKRGILVRRITWESPSGKIVEAEIKRLVHFSRPHLAAVSFSLKPVNFDGFFEFVSRIDGRVSNLDESSDFRVGSGLKGRALFSIGKGVDGTGAWLEQRTERSGFFLSCAVEHNLVPGGDAVITGHQAEEELEIRFRVKARRGIACTLFKYISYFTSRDAGREDLVLLARSEVSKAKEDGFALLEAEQEAFLEAFWKDADVVIEGDPAAQQGIRFSMFSLLQSAGRDGKTNIAAKGLTGEGYGGHYFWDSDIYMLPFFIYTRPEIAKALLMHRYRLLDAARERAGELGHRGALYPWRTIDGSECSAFFPAGTAQYHINADIVYAIKRYVEATGDEEFLYGYGAEIAFETARFWVDLGSYIPAKGGKFCINCVTGPDEYTALVDNNAYTNHMAKMNLEFAAKVAERMKRERPEDYRKLLLKIDLQDEEVDEWRRAAENMYLPYSEELGIIPQDDSFLYKKRVTVDRIPEKDFPLLLHWHYLNIYRHQICKQPDVLLLMFLLREKFTLEEIRRNYDYYEPVTTHDSSLSPPVFAALAAELGYYEEAYRYFIWSCRMDLDDYNGNTKDGIHAAAMGGAWLAAVYGFGGLKVFPDGLHFFPALPEKWRCLSFTLKYRGRKLRVRLEREKAFYTLEEGEPLKIHHFGAELSLKPGITVEREMCRAGI
ncbi:alpha,alpha-trehalose phosphorylase [Thermosediminibacter litoriperuensis]|uniref:Alpha,alpha-trehalose phosphorylase n=2 Tax=Thermosediminibacter litoriperuensis TaxID=291989 RepID=A0A5S5ALY4_9FIRM|nr:glycosyl hydrolase family 65 protein [Thermosediminibacter litoriperuensis]TYP51320.1 alpha,alpha-trehalose phosphorylase [Thermosediminibacter litoriperuensis]